MYKLLLRFTRCPATPSRLDHSGNVPTPVIFFLQCKTGHIHTLSKTHNLQLSCSLSFKYSANVHARLNSDSHQMVVPCNQDYQHQEQVVEFQCHMGLGQSSRPIFVSVARERKLKTIEDWQLN